MSQIGELKVFVSERLNAVASEILGAIEKTLTDHEDETSRLKEENHRLRSLLDIIVESKSPQPEGRPAPATAGHAKKMTPAAASTGASDSSSTRKARKTSYCQSEMQCLFTSRSDFLKLTAQDNCPYCLKKIQATEAHLTRRHYLLAVHFTEAGTEKFVVPCLCKDKIKGRSHWHCPYCVKTLHRKFNFELHISKQHGFTLLQQSQSAEIDQPSVPVFEEEVPLSPEPGYQQEVGSQHQEDRRASLLLQVKQEHDGETWRQNLAEKQVSHLAFQQSEPIQEGDSQVGEQSLKADHVQDSAIRIICVDSFIQDTSEIQCVQSSHEYPQPMDTPHTTGGGAVAENGSSSKAEEWKNHSVGSRSKAIKQKRNVKRSLPLVSLNIKKSTQLPTSQNITGPHSCKACGKIFHYMYTLRTHAQTHTKDKIHVCGICGKHLESTASLVRHLQSHTKRNKCGICGKQFSNNARLKRHRRFHRPKALNVMSSA